MSVYMCFRKNMGEDRDSPYWPGQTTNPNLVLFFET
jgi:hypothetical protein